MSCLQGTLHLSEKELAHILSHCRAELVLLRPRTAVIVLGVLQALVPLCSQVTIVLLPLIS